MLTVLGSPFLGRDSHCNPYSHHGHIACTSKPGCLAHDRRRLETHIGSSTGFRVVHPFGRA